MHIIFWLSFSIIGTKANPYLKNAFDNYMRSKGFTRAKSALANEVKNRLINDIKKAVKL